ncbi:membrane fusion component of tripartite multidrug resistance system [Myroides odoratimimus]|uniref:HlyD family secretion protein n=1 Tax=Myroides odoratimimus TaxID=76832 RepID=UPI00035449D2|nr:efflux RND transporter periplasmic adaptor subunit [Myroides odoratimimus]EPH12230.1 hypothetical protein HMPREF9713_01071 [Myroides odoratimimus CCUG 12700]MDM1067283.1 HlyD family secretion protein [Myroides odoratimimus]MDM1520567.1 HlyD family secretion protein [Myroides odoratimimus]STZ48543.1 Inner membrane protein yiaV precursor [Myroides odoratimimus]GAQ13293.1 membrane fusion component of tripartite multidrug resistance system [Myroides odoratimimus]
MTSRKRNYILFNTLTVVGVLVLVSIAIIEFFHLNDNSYTNSAQIEGHVIPIHSKVNAYVEKVNFKEHQDVKKGDTLFILNDSELRIQYQKAQSDLANAQAAYNQRLVAIKGFENNVGVVGSTIKESTVKVKYHQGNYTRYATLLKEQAVTHQQYEQIESQYLSERANLEKLIKQKRTTELLVQENKEALALDLAQIEKAKSAIALAKLYLSYTVIIAPHDGVIGRRYYNEGQLAQVNQQLTSLVESKGKWVTANYLEKQVKNLSIGQRVSISVDALGGREFIGTITAISGATGSKYAGIPIDNAVGNFVKTQQRIPVRIEFTTDNIDLDQLIAGMNVVVRLKK